MNDTPVQCSVIICAYNGEAVLPACLRTLAASEGVAFETIVVDNGSADATARLAGQAPDVKLIQAGRNLGFAGGNNLGIAAARGDIIVLLNQDTEVPPHWLARLCAAFGRNPQIGVVGCKLFYPGGKILQHTGGVLYPNGLTMHMGNLEEDRGQWDAPGERLYVTGAALGLRRAALEQAGLLDPGYYPAYYEEVDLQIRIARAGWKICYEPQAWLVHLESQVHGARSPRVVYYYTRNRLRLLAMIGFPQGLRAALRQEALWLADMRRQGLLPAVLRGYAAGLVRWPAWRLDRKTRKTVPRLE